MTRKGTGANVDTEKSKLSDYEWILLEFFINRIGEAYTAKQILDISDNDIDIDIRKISSTLSNLVGMDLIKSTNYRMTMSEEEQKKWEPSQEPKYFMSERGTPWYERAGQVLGDNGKLKILSQLSFGLDLFPNRKITRFEIEFPIIRTCGLSTIQNKELEDFMTKHEGMNCKMTLEIF